LHLSQERYSETHCYYMVGECFVHGIMDGEGLKDLTQVENWRAAENFILL